GCPCDCYVRSGAESSQDSVRHFAFAYISAGYFHARGKMGYCSVDIIYRKRGAKVARNTQKIFSSSILSDGGVKVNAAICALRGLHFGTKPL
ncbi:MAG: hypothetical protein PUK11_06905, partial [Oscillibacter sp.]|nr:hypothetical protein [Oscillibacter sp.]MDY5711395.1 hypothetical protein [Oscillospiraceae bacterium]